MMPIEHFRFCPSCGQGSGKRSRDAFECPGCGFLYYFNPASAAAAFVLNSNSEALFIRRAKEPAKGKLAIPGGFVDAGETFESAVRREVREEVNLELGPLDYLCSAPNEYSYKGVTYPVVDMFFVAHASSVEQTAALDGVESFIWRKPAEIKSEELAFPSVRAALSSFLKRTGTTCPTTDPEVRLMQS